ncbi:hypothetical protein JCGZ_26887 [Jatropha curcas]|uniref:Uncharacterized protein n=1 Tax=Jatropha curcas TaxID=180498 RepID=A0A067LCP5_JATCU|nr:hypothetical protein JCGZ_26887 [Jatropha curcas]
MLQCLSLHSPSATSTSRPNSPTTVDHHPQHQENSPPLCPGTSTDGTPVSSIQQSPTVNVTREYFHSVQSNSYNEMWSKVNDSSNHQELDVEQIELPFNNENDEDARQFLLTQVLQPNRECVEEALRYARPNTLTRLVSDYFEHSEKSTHNCLLLHQSVYRARVLYAPLHKLLEVLDLDSLTQSQCDNAYEIFLQFDSVDNPFPCRNSHKLQDIRHSFSQLRQQLDRRLNKSQSRVRLVRRTTAACVLCIIGSVVAVSVAAVCIATHTFIAFVACPICSVTNLPRKLTKKEVAHAKQLDAASRGTYVLKEYLLTIESIVAQLYASVEDDKDLIRLGLGRSCEKHLISEVLKHLRKKHLNFIELLKDLEERIILCFNAVNRSRSLLLQEIHLYQTS